MFSTNTQVQVSLNRASLFFCNAHQSTRSFRIKLFEGVFFQQVTLEVAFNELTVVIAAEAECCLSKVVCTKAEEVCVFCNLVCSKSCAREFDHGTNLELQVSAFLFVYLCDNCFCLCTNLCKFVNRNNVRNHDAYVMLKAFLLCFSGCQSNSFNLHFVNFRIGNCNTNTTVSKHGVSFLESVNLNFQL